MIEQGWFDADSCATGPTARSWCVMTTALCCAPMPRRRRRRRFRRVGRGARHRTSATTARRGATTSRRPGSPCAARSRSRPRRPDRLPPGIRTLRRAVPRAIPPEHAAAITGRRGRAIRQTAHLLWHHRPLAYFTWTGLEQHTNATQTARAHSILHALTGCIDVPGGNVQLAQVPVNNVSGDELRPAGQWQKALGTSERPLGTAAGGWVTSDEIYRAILDGTAISGARRWSASAPTCCCRTPTRPRGAAALARARIPCPDRSLPDPDGAASPTSSCPSRAPGSAKG